MIVLIGGGSRSGKTRFALDYASKRGNAHFFIATAEPRDEEMQQRIDAHRQQRGAGWTTIEEPIELADAISRTNAGASAIVVDCLTLWVSNLMFANRDIGGECRRVIDAASQHPATVVFVTNEVGCGIVPDNQLARRFRDEAGFVNQQIAAASDEVWFLAFGCSLRLK